MSQYNIMVKTSIGGKVIMIYDLTDDTKILEVKEKIQAQIGIPTNQIRLIWSGKERVDTDTLKLCGIKAKSTLVMAVRTVGGSKIQLITKELLKDVDTDTLKLCGFKAKSTLVMAVRTDGSKIKIITKELLKDTKLQITNEPDYLSLNDDEPRVKMPCGHPWAPSSITEHVLDYLDKKERPTEIKCPCGVTWDYLIVRQAAMLTEDECAKIEEKLSLNYADATLKTFTCPTCYLICTPPENDVKNPRVRCQGKNCPTEFCAMCLKPWESLGSNSTVCKSCALDPTYCNEVLKKSPLKNIGTSILNVPKWRCCPRTNLHSYPVLIEHEDHCKHIKCPECKKEFCFVCLQLKLENNSWPTTCKGAYDMCTLAATQVM